MRTNMGFDGKRLPATFLATGLLMCLALPACTPRGAAPATGGAGDATAAGAGLPAIQYEAHISAGDRPPPGARPRNPHAGDAAVAKNGAMLFAAMNCDGCHGGGGSGWVGPNLADGRWRYGGADEEIFSSIYYGRPKGMPAFGGALGPEGVWTLVTYLKSLPVPADEATESWEH
ncbi:MAG: c-type cytochrome [Proteobacteria bacterium]|nr:c-type cytochrome [Pseudomonadota bacterium]